jgi:hypothetical protein
MRMAATAEGPPTLFVVVFALVSLFVLATVAVMIVTGEQRFRLERQRPSGDVEGGADSGSDVQTQTHGDDVADLE